METRTLRVPKSMPATMLTGTVYSAWARGLRGHRTSTSPWYAYDLKAIVRRASAPLSLGSEMPEPSTLVMVADLVIRRVLAEHGKGPELPEALRLAYPFADDAGGLEAWKEALRIHNIAFDDWEAADGTSTGTSAIAGE